MDDPWWQAVKALPEEGSGYDPDAELFWVGKGPDDPSRRTWDMSPYEAGKLGQAMNGIRQLWAVFTDEKP